MRSMRFLAPALVLCVSCAMPSSASLDRPADRPMDRGGRQPDVPAAPITGTRESTEIVRLRQAGDDRQLLAFVEDALESGRSRSAAERGWLGDRSDAVQKGKPLSASF